MRQWGNDGDGGVGGMTEVRTFAIAVASVIAGACGGSPAAPTMTLSVPALAAGNYTLRVDPGTGQGTPTFCMAVSINGASVPFTSASVPVVVTSDGTVWTMRPTPEADRGLVIVLRVAGATFDGTATGRALDGGTLLTFGTQGATPEPARLSGSPVQTNILTGAMTGAVTFEIQGASGSCTAYAWSLR